MRLLLVSIRSVQLLFFYAKSLQVRTENAGSQLPGSEFTSGVWLCIAQTMQVELEVVHFDLGWRVPSSPFKAYDSASTVHGHPPTISFPGEDVTRTHPQPSTPNPELQTQTPNPKPQTLDYKPKH